MKIEKFFSNILENETPISHLGDSGHRCKRKGGEEDRRDRRGRRVLGRMRNERCCNPLAVMRHNKHQHCVTEEQITCNETFKTLKCSRACGAQSQGLVPKGPVGTSGVPLYWGPVWSDWCHVINPSPLSNEPDLKSGDMFEK